MRKNQPHYVKRRRERALARRQLNIVCYGKAMKEAPEKLPQTVATQVLEQLGRKTCIASDECDRLIEKLKVSA